MARPLDYVLEEIVRVADDLDVNPRLLLRSKFLPKSDVSKHDLDAYGGFSKLRADAAHTHGIESHKKLAESRGVELRNSYVRKLERQRGTADYLSDKLLKGITDVFKSHPISIPKSTVKLKKPDSPERMLTLLWSDLHFGLDVDSREVLNSEYNWRVAARRLALTCKQAVQFKPEHRDETSLQIVLNGDILAGVIHLSEANIKETQEQIWGATAILTHGIAFLRKYFGKINVLCLPGNHDRMTYRGHDRAVSQRWNSHAHSVFLGLKCWFQNTDGVTFDIPMAGMGTYEAPGGSLIFASHGDTEPTTSNVGKSFNVEQTTKSLLKMSAGAVFGKKVDVVLFGHWHQPSLFMLPDGTTCIINGCLIGSDPFAQNGVGFFNTMPAQVMFESVPGFPVGDFRVIQLRSADKDKSLDEIIHIPGLELGGLIDF